jgi:hypothetical protein
LGTQDSNADSVDRLLIGQAVTYPADLTIKDSAPKFAGSMLERRKLGWSIIQKVVEPVGIDATTQEKLPRFQTWYEQSEVFAMFNQLFTELSPADRLARAPFTAQAIQQIFPWNVARSPSAATFSQQRYNQRKADLTDPQVVASLGKQPRVLMSPDYVGHLFDSYNQMQNCFGSDPVDPASGQVPTDPATSAAFAPCLNGEFPANAVAVKTRWMPSTSPVPTYDTSADAITKRFANGSFPDLGDASTDPDAAHSYRMKGDATTDHWTLTAFHIMTKELRDWVWITVWWSPDPDTDFGADRPAALANTPWANYKMCVVTAYDEQDKAPGTGLPDSLAAAVNAANAAGPASWCSNPYLESAEHAAKTNCIGCHQNGGTRETTDTILADPDTFADNSRKRIRNDFPADYAFTTQGGLELAAGFKSRADNISPQPTPAPPTTTP